MVTSISGPSGHDNNGGVQVGVRFFVGFVVGRAFLRARSNPLVVPNPYLDITTKVSKPNIMHSSKNDVSMILAPGGALEKALPSTITASVGTAVFMDRGDSWNHPTEAWYKTPPGTAGTKSDALVTGRMSAFDAVLTNLNSLDIGNMLTGCTLELCSRWPHGLCALGRGWFYIVCCAWMQCGCQQFGVARVLLQFRTERTHRTAIFEIDILRGQYMNQCLLGERAWSVNIEWYILATSKLIPDNAC